MLVFDGILAVSARGMVKLFDHDVLSLLSLDFQKDNCFNKIELIFSGNMSIKLDAEFIYLRMKDLEEKISAGCSSVPSHKI